MAVRISVAAEGGAATVRVAGRLDAEAAGHLAGQLDEVLAEGLREVLIDLTDVTYLSTPATTLLRRRADDFMELRGELRIVAVAPTVLAVLRDAGLGRRLVALEDDAIQDGATSWQPRLSLDQTFDGWRAPVAGTTRGRYESTPLDEHGTLRCDLVGDPDAAIGPPRAGSGAVLPFGGRAFGLGLGAIGTTLDEARHRAGELIGLPAFVACTPTEGQRVPDAQAGTDLFPRAALFSGLRCEGHFRALVRFQPLPDTDAVPLAEVLMACLHVTKSSVVGVVIAAQVGAMLTATRRLSPAMHAGPASFAPRAMADWISFTPEPAWSGTTVLLAGVASRHRIAALAPQLRPFGDPAGLHGHLHALFVPFQPLPSRTVTVRDVAHQLTEGQRLLGVAHALFDPAREAEGRGNTLVRGLAWTAPIDEFGTLG
ncbi:MAG: STAS domain-containing protein [Gemmatimonadales bacterium]|nr:STAS domain-containing protein [Gemmatimonadales bacterium]